MGARAGLRALGVRVAAVVALGLVAAASPQLAAAQEHPPGHGGPGGDGKIPTSDPPWSDEQREILLGMIDAAETDLPAFADAEALPDEYIEFGDPHLGGYWHYINWEMFDDGHILDPKHPEALVYHQETDGSLRLVSAMYILETGTDMTNIPEDIAWMPGWHTHGDICVNETTKKFTGLGPPCSTGSRTFDGPPMMHVWLEDPGCGHRFGGIDIGGLHCDVEGHPGGHDPDPDPDPHPHDPDPHPHDPDPHPHDPGNNGNDGHHHDPAPATPVHHHPHLTG